MVHLNIFPSFIVVLLSNIPPMERWKGWTLIRTVVGLLDVVIMIHNVMACIKLHVGPTMSNL
jgi:hypothetical protein